MEYKNFKKYYIIPAEPEMVFKALTTPHIIRLWSGDNAEMSTEIGSEFSLWDGSICGVNLEFETNKKIVQEWFFGEQEQQSIVTIKLHENPKGTSLELLHTNIPSDSYDDIIDGWNLEYMYSLIDFYTENDSEESD
jgi:uncharacterized protein YndB with AHSA1/START domain